MTQSGGLPGFLHTGSESGQNVTLWEKGPQEKLQVYGRIQIEQADHHQDIAARALNVSRS